MQRPRAAAGVPSTRDPYLFERRSKGSETLLWNGADRRIDLGDQLRHPQIVVSVDLVFFGVVQQRGTVDVDDRECGCVEFDEALRHVPPDVKHGTYLARLLYAALPVGSRASTDNCTADFVDCRLPCLIPGNWDIRWVLDQLGSAGNRRLRESQ